MSIQKAFDEIAMNVFHSYEIKRDNEEFELVEIEVYLIDPSKDVDDVFIHQSDEQMKNEHLYWHYSGIDICLGSEEDKVYCGVLIRGIKNDKGCIHGPGRVAYERDKKKRKRDISLIHKNSTTNYEFFTSSTKTTDLANIIFKLPRVNLSRETILKNMNNDTKAVYKYLNVKARYIRLVDNHFAMPKKIAPDELREVFNEYLQFRIQTENIL